LGVSSTADPQKQLAAFSDLLKRKLAAAGIDAAGPIELTDLGEDQVRVGSDNPTWAKIEQLLAGDPSLRNAFQKVAGAFASQNPAPGEHFRLTLAGEQANVTFV
jgi:hypothetical protein